MSGYPQLRPQASSTKSVDLPNGSYGVPNAMLHGFQVGRASSGTGPQHPLENSEKLWDEHQFKLDCAMLKNSQGLHAPLKLHMERHITSQITRLPGLQSSNILLDTLTGKDETVEFADILNTPGDSELMADVHMMMEARAGLL